ncbi:MAG: hypothetical protein GY898_04115 [Proteobacteria bacterium]|nr:hypothetical protein [Pseudomonadota bacterium]
MLTRTLLIAALCLPLVACGGADDDDSSEPTPEPVPDFVRATVALTDAAGGSTEGITVTFDDQEEGTDGTGRADITVPTLETFDITVDAGADYQEYSVAGVVGGDDFIFQTLISDRATTDFVYGSLGLVADAGKGILVVSLDTVALQAATGGSASIDAAHDEPFIFVNDTPQAGSELIFEAQAFISFPNVEPGDVTIDIVPPESDICLAFPALSAEDDVTTYTVRADTVTVVTFICQ